MTAALGVLLLVGSVHFYLGQQRGGAIGGPLSLPKLLWLDYALTAWFLAPIYFGWSRRFSPGLRRIYRLHLLSFSVRGALELWLLYGPHAWIPPYGIAHDLGQILLLTWLDRATVRAPAGADTTAEAAGRRFLWSIRLGLVAEVLFAGLFYQAMGGRTDAVWFADDTARFRFINGVTLAIAATAWLDLGYTLLQVRGGPGARRSVGAARMQGNRGGTGGAGNVSSGEP
ncbi:MAG: hypothetical protein FJX77_11780 [Armatimonadetes bacterium]|nr:hypothetical protein [Armatimonadota bacterium]